MPKYQINATIKKPGGGPVKWTHYTDESPNDFYQNH
ncbi:DUF1187 family protein [Escherichia coli]